MNKDSKRRVMPPTYFFVLLLAGIGLHFVYNIRIVHQPYTYIGGVLIVFGIVLNLWTDSLFKKAGTTVKPHEKPTGFIVKGPFRFSRHPMYLGMISILTGTALLFGNLVVFISPLVFFILMESLFIPMEEKNLTKGYKKRYASYRKKVRRWI
jgi:protein-S-isoprenylcysteine O-methyltransferase Ste14